MLIEYRQIGRNWQFSPWQLEVLKRYYQANQLLVDCLNCDCRYSWEMRAEIEATLLLSTTSSN